RAVRKQQRRQQVALLALANRDDALVLGRAFGAVVEGQVVAVAVLVLLPVRLIVLLVVGNEIGEGEAVMGGQEVDAGPGPAAALVVDVARPGDARREIADDALLALPIGADRVAVLVVPLRPARRK